MLGDAREHGAQVVLRVQPLSFAEPRGSSIRRCILTPIICRSRSRRTPSEASPTVPCCYRSVSSAWLKTGCSNDRTNRRPQEGPAFTVHLLHHVQGHRPNRSPLRATGPVRLPAIAAGSDSVNRPCGRGLPRQCG
jgi:hypothetical protein